MDYTMIIMNIPITKNHFYYNNNKIYLYIKCKKLMHALK